MVQQNAHDPECTVRRDFEEATVVMRDLVTLTEEHSGTDDRARQWAYLCDVFTETIRDGRPIREIPINVGKLIVMCAAALTEVSRLRTGAGQ